MQIENLFIYLFMVNISLLIMNIFKTIMPENYLWTNDSFILGHILHVDAYLVVIKNICLYRQTLKQKLHKKSAFLSN